MQSTANIKAKKSNPIGKLPTYNRPSIIIGIGLLGFIFSSWLSFKGYHAIDPAAKDVLYFYANGLLVLTVMTSVFMGYFSMKGLIRSMDAEKAELARVNRALDVTSANVMIADANYNIIYLNEAVQDMFRFNENCLRQELPHFNIQSLLGSSLDVFYKDPSHQRELLDKLQSTHKTEIDIGGRIFKLVTTPIFDENENKMGVIVEWRDRTDEALTEREIEQVMALACNGELDKRIDVTNKRGFFKNVSANLNGLLELVQTMITDVSHVMGALANGDLTQSIESDYKGTFNEVKCNINSTITNLSELIVDIRHASTQVNVGTNEIAQGNQDLQQRTESQASALEETAATMEEISGSVKSSSENARKASSLSADAKHKAERGGTVVEEVVRAMSTIKESSSKIVDIIGVIDDIAFQTNLLALNAAVEAARAGEQGKGFAVVAAEVRNLAQRSATSAKEIKELIQDSVSKVDEGTSLANQSGESLSELLESVNEVNDMIASISKTTEEQASSILQINEAVANMDVMTQQNSALVEELAAASSQMSGQSMRLTKQVEVFQVAGGASFGNESEASFHTGGGHAPETVVPASAVNKVKSPLTKDPGDYEEHWESF